MTAATLSHSLVWLIAVMSGAPTSTAPTITAPATTGPSTASAPTTSPFRWLRATTRPAEEPGYHREYYVDWETGFSEGLGEVEVDGKWGFIDAQGTLVIPPAYDQAA